ncbi:baseplate J/gp47 family protein [Lentisphaerota bacterium WC36G]|nr:baseplate J/gp47 family protein [Lentisphaerae bacterium WC36]
MSSNAKNTFNAIDLAELPPPNVIEQLDYEEILQSMIDDFVERDPNFTALLESDPAYKIFEAAAYRELLLRARINNAARANMLAFAISSDLEHLGALFNIDRRIIESANNEALPPTPAIYESDESLRNRILLSLEAITTAGSAGSYIFHTLNSDVNVLDCAVNSEVAGTVEVAILTSENANKTEVKNAVENSLNADSVRPLTDNVNVSLATIKNYNVAANIIFKEGVSPEIVLENARKCLDDYAAKCYKIGATVALSGIYSALHQTAGVVKVVLSNPTTDLVPSWNEVYKIENITITNSGVTDE